ncbi:MAG: helix-turn-helix transcriptional regulator [Thauera sp.]|nr:helix-turn-helix transcriptional regulator [Thauera sp.]
MPSNTVGDRIKAVRAAHGLNQREFASRTSTSSGRISELEQGNSMPGCEFLTRLHTEFGVDLNWLLTGKASEGAVALTAPAPLPRDEADLLTLYRDSTAQGKAAIKATSLAVEKSPAAITPATARKRAR